MFFELNQNLILCCQVATRITTFFIEHFGMRDLFGRENYEYYARLTGRILKVSKASPTKEVKSQVPPALTLCDCPNMTRKLPQTIASQAV